MSMHFWTERGYGVDSHVLKTSDKHKKADFVRNHLYGSLKSWVEHTASDTGTNINDDDEFTEMFAEYESENTAAGYGIGIDVALADIMAHETGMTIEATSINESGEYAIILPESMPWNYSDAERVLNPYDLDEIFDNYMSAIGATTGQTDHVSIECYG